MGTVATIDGMAQWRQLMGTVVTIDGTVAAFDGMAQWRQFYGTVATILWHSGKSFMAQWPHLMGTVAAIYGYSEAAIEHQPPLLVFGSLISSCLLCAGA